MIATLQTQRVRSLEPVRAFLEGSEAVDFIKGDREGVDDLVRRTLVRLGYHRLGKSDKGQREGVCAIGARARKVATAIFSQVSATASHECQRGSNPL